MSEIKRAAEEQCLQPSFDSDQRCRHDVGWPTRSKCQLQRLKVQSQTLTHWCIVVVVGVVHSSLDGLRSTSSFAQFFANTSSTQKTPSAMHCMETTSVVYCTLLACCCHFAFSFISCWNVNCCQGCVFMLNTCLLASSQNWFFSVLRLLLPVNIFIVNFVFVFLVYFSQIWMVLDSLVALMCYQKIIHWSHVYCPQSKYTSCHHQGISAIKLISPFP